MSTPLSGQDRRTALECLEANTVQPWELALGTSVVVYKIEGDGVEIVSQGLMHSCTESTITLRPLSQRHRRVNDFIPRQRRPEPEAPFELSLEGTLIALGDPYQEWLDATQPAS